MSVFYLHLPTALYSEPTTRLGQQAKQASCHVGYNCGDDGMGRHCYQHCGDIAHHTMERIAVTGDIHKNIGPRLYQPVANKQEDHDVEKVDAVAALGKIA